LTFRTPSTLRKKQQTKRTTVILALFKRNFKFDKYRAQHKNNKRPCFCLHKRLFLQIERSHLLCGFYQLAYYGFMAQAKYLRYGKTVELLKNFTKHCLFKFYFIFAEKICQES
jgi:hypothetical protein